MKKLNKLLCLAAMLLPWAISAQTTGMEFERPVLSAYMLEAGSAHIAETYLSPLKYSGWGISMAYERMQAMRFNPENWVMQLYGRLRTESTRNPARNARMWDLGLELRWGMEHVFRLTDKWKLFAGGSTGIDLGALYSPRNSNNPVAAKGAWNVGFLGAAAWNGALGRLPICLRYQAQLPVAGIFFSPAYGELYYEIYMGNHKGLLRPAWFGNYFRLDNLLTADLRFGNTILRLGYRLDIFSQKASDIVTRRISHSAVIGLVNEWISLGSGRSITDRTRIINALY